VRRIARVVRAIGREIAAALRLEADLTSHVSPQDVARRHIRGELGRDSPDPGQRSTVVERLPGWVVIVVVAAIVIAVVIFTG
jgi:hypothetical protein